TPDDMVSAASPILELLNRLTERRPWLFVMGPRGIDGIVTIYDLNEPAAHQLGFGLCLVVEAALGHAIEAAIRVSDEEFDVDVDQRIRDKIRGLSRKETEIRSRA